MCVPPFEWDIKCLLIYKYYFYAETHLYTKLYACVWDNLLVARRHLAFKVGKPRFRTESDNIAHFDMYQFILPSQTKLLTTTIWSPNQQTTWPHISVRVDLFFYIFFFFCLLVCLFGFFFVFRWGRVFFFFCLFVCWVSFLFLVGGGFFFLFLLVCLFGFFFVFSWRVFLFPSSLLLFCSFS